MEIEEIEEYEALRDRLRREATPNWSEYDLAFGRLLAQVRALTRERDNLQFYLGSTSVDSTADVKALHAQWLADKAELERLRAAVNKITSVALAALDPERFPNARQQIIEAALSQARSAENPGSARGSIPGQGPGTEQPGGATT